MPPQVTDVQKALKGADYPVNRAQLVELAQRNGAGQEIASRAVGPLRLGGLTS
jgi:hypothetical protein